MSFGANLGPLEMRSHSTANPMSFWAKFHHFCVNPKADVRDSLYRVRLGLGIGILGLFWGKLGSFGVSLSPLEIRSHSTANPMSFWVKFHHFCVNPKADMRDSLYRVRLGLGIGILGPFWGKLGSFGANLGPLGQIWVLWRSAAIPLRTQCHFGPKSAIFATIQSESEGIHFMGFDRDWELGFWGHFGANLGLLG